MPRGEVAFVEVKQRASADAAGFSLDHYRLRHVAAAAEQRAPRLASAGDDIRIDAFFIVPGRRPNHLENVWQG
jgi:putative endonuclease